MKRYFLIIVMLILIGGECQKQASFVRNPNLEIFLSDSLSSSPSNYYSPVWAPSGDKIYCIARKDEGLVYRHMLISIHLPNKEISVIVEDSVMKFTLSHSGNEIAYVKLHTDTLIKEKIVFIDAITGEVKNVFFPNSPYIVDLKYTHDDKFLIFLTKGDTSVSGFYSLNLSTWKDTLILKIPLSKDYFGSFTLHPQNDSIIMGDSENMWYPQFHPTNFSLLGTVKNIYFYDLNEDEEIFLLDLSTNERKALNAKPYYYTDIQRISFSPDGSKIIFSAAKPFYFEGPHFECQELWILNLK